ncbi:putative mediator of RNA polymerase II transcription subunit 26 [Drosophila pseudoobscura]|uniref:Mediator of RNA polymerase II transcription subunit 26 n=1 Tax=Drosophila pseudoobscura pseudoobscura TaxID=46245 RepID=A0A6I8UC84_DROPS|nr:putative mediator of RNA polymerase II transcription subunit 26 [Drosophila pseudoobscura]
MKMQRQLFLVVATVAFCGGIAQAQQQQGGVDPAYLRQYYQQLQQQQQQSSQGAETPIYEQNSEQTQQYVNAGQQIRLKDTVAEQIRAQQQQGYVAPAVRDYLQQPQYQSQQQPQSVYRQSVQAAPAPPPRRVQQQQPAYQAPSLLGKGQQKLSLQQQQQQRQQQQQEEEEYDDQNSSYQFGFDVKDDEFTNYQNRKEVRDGSVIKGSYSVVDSDGFIRTVKYTADPKEGFKAEVIREPTDIVVKIPTPPPATQLLRAGGHKGQQEYSPSHSHSPGKQQYQHQQQQQPQYHQYQ